ncbi:MAG: recombinase family protein [Ruminococcus flavefaciens]|nr:recombinase family protein [Ruminococcus flavefaciens]
MLIKQNCYIDGVKVFLKDEEQITKYHIDKLLLLLLIYFYSSKTVFWTKPVHLNVSRFVLYKLVKISSNMEGYEAKLCILFYGKEIKMKKQKRISFGYTRNDMNEIVIYEEQAEVVKLIFELYSFDQSLSKISKHLEIYSVPSPSNKPFVWQTNNKQRSFKCELSWQFRLSSNYK